MRSILNAQPGPRDLKQFASSILGASLPHFAWIERVRVRFGG
jgi:hypothetical protein